MTRLFTTAGISADRKEEAWQEFCSEVFFRLEVNPLGAVNDDCFMEHNATGEIGITKYQVTTQERFVRKKQAAAHDKVENLVIVFPLSGLFECAHRGKNMSTTSGQFYCMNSMDGYCDFVSQSPRSLVLTAPIPLLKDRVRSVEDLAGRNDLSNSSLVPVVKSFFLEAVNIGSPTESSRLQDCGLDLVSLMLEGGLRNLEGDQIPWSMKESLFTSITTYIRKKYKQHGVSARHAAAALRVSERYIHKILNEKNTTFNNLLMDYRLMEGKKLLTDQQTKSRLQIGEIAYECGFVSQAHFATKYKQKFGLTPREQRMLIFDNFPLEFNNI